MKVVLRRAAGRMRGALGWTMLTSNFTTDAVTVAAVSGLCSSGAPAWPVLEANIASVQAAMLAGRLTCSQLVGAYVQAGSLACPAADDLSIYHA